MTLILTIIRNSAKCLICKQNIESRHRHDLVFCKCYNISVDGGKTHLSRSANQIDKMIDTSIIDPPDYYERKQEELIREQQATEKDLGNKYTSLIDLLDDVADIVDAHIDETRNNPIYLEAREIYIRERSPWYRTILSNYEVSMRLQELLKIREKFR